MNFNEKEVRECYQFVAHKKETEIRIIDPLKKSPPQSIFVHTEDEFVDKCKQYNGKYNIYVGINERSATGTSKTDIVGFKTLVIDIDAVRKKGFEKEPATESELKDAEKITDNIVDHIKEGDQPIPVKLCSGNGYQLWFAIPEIVVDNLNRDMVEEKSQLFQDEIKRHFDINNAIDKIGDLPRIIKIWGSYNIKSEKGIPTKERPFRVAKIIGDYKRVENQGLLKQLLELEKPKKEFVIDKIEQINMNALPPCLKKLLNDYENSDGNYWYRIVQMLASFFFSIGLDEDHTEKIIQVWNKKQPYHEENEEFEIENIVQRIFKNRINCPNCFKIKEASGGFPYFGLAELEICSPDNKCNQCINPVIRYKRFEEEENTINNLGDKIGLMMDKCMMSEEIFKVQPFYYDEARNWWLWDNKQCKWERVDDTGILNSIKKTAVINTINSKERNEILEALKQVGREKAPKPIKSTWIQFRDTIVDIETGEQFKATPKWFVANPIPYDLNKNGVMETPVMDKIFEEWVGKENVKLLYEILSYCLIPDYPIHRIFCFIGAGMNGKSCFLNLLRKFVGGPNCCSTELDTLLQSRFEVTRLHKKLVCQMGETDFSEMNKTSTLKKLSGGDLIGFEYKNKDHFEDINYAKIIIATNNLPATSDKTIGFYRRWMIIDFPNQFSEKKDILADIPEEEYCALTNKCAFILKGLLAGRTFTNEGSVDDRMKKYEDHSNPLEKFLKEFTNHDGDGFIWKYDFSKKLNSWCKQNRFREISDVHIGKKMKELGITQSLKVPSWDINKKYRVWNGINFTEEQVEQVEQEDSTRFLHGEIK